MPIPWEGLGIALAAFVAMLGKTLYNGKGRTFIKNARSEHRTSRNAHEAIPEVVDKLGDIDEKTDHIYTKVESVESKTDRNAALIREFHGEDPVDVTVNDILEEDNDFYRGGGAPDG